MHFCPVLYNFHKKSNDFSYNLGIDKSCGLWYNNRGDFNGPVAGDPDRISDRHTYMQIFLLNATIWPIHPHFPKHTPTPPTPRARPRRSDSPDRLSHMLRSTLNANPYPSPHTRSSHIIANQFSLPLRAYPNTPERTSLGQEVRNLTNRIIYDIIVKKSIYFPVRRPYT